MGPFQVNGADARAYPHTVVTNPDLSGGNCLAPPLSDESFYQFFQVYRHFSTSAMSLHHRVTVSAETVDHLTGILT